MSAPFTKLDEPLDEESTMWLCRGCLAESGEMKNIFEWGLAQDFYDCTNIQINKSDALSELLCTNCENSLQASKRFKLQCQQSDLTLRKTAQKRYTTAANPETLPTEAIGQNTISYILNEDKLVFLITAPNANEKIFLPCPFCASPYRKQKDLLLHLTRAHKKSSEFVIELKYYCNISQCIYCFDSGKEKFFHGRKYLNQHFIKVHKARTYQCGVCNQLFPAENKLKSHLSTCSMTFMCTICEVKYSCKERLLVHLLRKHPDLHKQYKKEKSAVKRPSSTITESKKAKSETDRLNDYICDSPKRSFATQTRPEDNIKNDVSLPSWQVKNDNYETKTDEISTQTVFEDLLSLKSQNSEDDPLFETVSLSDIQTQTFPLEFGLSRSNKETLTEQSVDLSIKETQTCFCLCDSPKVNYKLFDSVSSSPCSLNLISSETQTSDVKSTVKSDVLLSFNSAETQTSFEEMSAKKDI